jgi:outer membrane receptor protein involved in Fe transport
VSSTSGVTDYRYVNVERAHTAGGDLSARVKAIDALSLEAAYAYLWTRDDATKEPLPNRPAHTVSLAALLELQKLNANLRYRVVSSALAGDGESSSPSFGLLDARVAYQVWPALSVFVGALNLTDVVRNPLQVTDTRPVLGRQFFLGLSGDAPVD